MGVRKNATEYLEDCGDTKLGLRHVGKTIENRKFKRVKNEWERRNSGIETKRESVRFLSRLIAHRIRPKLQDNTSTEIRLRLLLMLLN